MYWIVLFYLYRKGEVDYYTREIEECKLGTAEYITYLNQQKDKKVSVIQDLIDRTIRQKESFSNKKVAKEQENILKISSLKLQIEQIESKLELKHEEVAHLSDIATRRARHEASVASIRKDMLDAETAHKLRISQVERQLLETRMKCQREADAKVIEMQSAAHDKASKYLEAHTKLLGM